MYISVKTKQGRVAYSAAVGGRRIPTDAYVSVQATSWTDRLLNVHGDIELQPAVAPETKVAVDVAKK